MQKLNEINNNTRSSAMRTSLIKNLLPHSIKRISAEIPQETLLSLAPRNNISIEFNFLKMHPEERIEHQSLCLTWKDILMIYNIIKSDEIGIVGDSDGIISKTFNKLTFHEETFQKKIEKDAKEGKKLIYICLN